MTIQDQVVGAIACWREARGGLPQPQAMQAILNVLLNRVLKRGTDVYTEATRKGQFTSITGQGDPELGLWPTDNDTQWQMALQLAQRADEGNLPDLTSGATLYFSPASMAPGTTVPYQLPDGTATVFPRAWNQSVVNYTASIGGSLFFTEK